MASIAAAIMSTDPLRPLWVMLASPWGVRYIILNTILLPFIIHYLTTYLLAFRACRRARTSPGPHSPPIAPYAVPILAHTFQFAFRTENFLWHTLSLFPSTPFRLFVGPQRFTFLPHGDLVPALFRISRDLTSKPLTITSLRDAFALPPTDLALFLSDDSGIHTKPLPGFSSLPAGHRVFFTQHRDLHAFLSGSALDAMTARFITFYATQLRTTPSIPPRSEGWTVLPDLYAFLRTQMFTAATTALCGPHLLRLSPSLVDDFWTFDRDIMVFLRRTPRVFARTAHANRDRVVDALARWHEYAAAQYVEAEEEEPEWEPQWGARLSRARVRMMQGAGVSARGRAALDLGLVWGTNANVIPSTMWAVVGVFLTPGLEGRVRAEVDACWDAEGELDLGRLCGMPLLTSVYHEALRYSVAATAARDLLVPEVEVGWWRFERGETLMVNPWFAGRDKGFWNVGRVVGGRPEHPVDEFWAERFLEYPDDPASGPIRKKDESVYEKASGKPKTVEDDRTARVVTAGTAGHFFPYGGGTKICPGRFFAKQEMLGAIAVLMREFEIELVDVEASRKTRPDMKYFPAGSLPPDRAVPVRMRRRR